MTQVNEFIKQRERDWKRLEDLMARMRRQALSPVEIHELGGLYRSTMSDLAIARRDYANERVIVYLNQLLTRAHSTIYQDDTSSLERLNRYVVRTIPTAFRRIAGFVLAAFILFMVPAVIGYRLAVVNPQAAEPLGLEEQRAILAEHETWTDIPPNVRPVASTFIITNNVRIAILAFAGGVSFGLFTVYILAMNGLVIGAVVGLAAHYGMVGSLLDFMVAHGVLELSIIFMSGGAGLALGWAMLNPGRLTRANAMRVAAVRSVSLAVLAVPVLLIAGLIEGFISPTGIASVVKILVGVGTGAVLYAYLMHKGREI